MKVAAFLLACATVGAFAGDRVVNGYDTTVAQFPYIVGLKNSGSFPYCGGSIIAPTWIVSAAHCFGTGAVDVADWVVVPGLSTTADVQAAGGIAVQAVYVHPAYDVNTMVNDIALVELAAPVNISSTVYPIRVNFNTATPVAGDVLNITGWGDVIFAASLFGINSPTTLQTANVAVQTSEVTDLVLPSQTLIDNFFLIGSAAYGATGCRVNGAAAPCTGACYASSITATAAADCCGSNSGGNGIYAEACKVAGGSDNDCRVSACSSPPTPGAIYAFGLPPANPTYATLGRDTCQGDSGGPAELYTSADDRLLVGVTSNGISCATVPIPGAYWPTALAESFIRSKIPFGSLPWDASGELALCWTERRPALTCDQVKALYGLPADATCAAAAAGDCLTVQDTAIPLSGWVVSWTSQAVTDGLDYDDLCGPTPYGYICKYNAEVTDIDGETDDKSGQSFGPIPAENIDAGVAGLDEDDECPWASKVYEYKVDGVVVKEVLATCDEFTKARRADNTAVLVLLFGCEGDVACCEDILSEIKCDAVHIDECACGVVNATAECDLEDCNESKKGLLGLLGLLGLIPLLLCLGASIILACCLIRRRKTEKDVHFATFDPHTPTFAAAPAIATVGCNVAPVGSLAVPTNFTACPAF